MEQPEWLPLSMNGSGFSFIRSVNPRPSSMSTYYMLLCVGSRDPKANQVMQPSGEDAPASQSQEKGYGSAAVTTQKADGVNRVVKEASGRWWHHEHHQKNPRDKWPRTDWPSSTSRGPIPEVGRESWVLGAERTSMFLLSCSSFRWSRVWAELPPTLYFKRIVFSPVSLLHCPTFA